MNRNKELLPKKSTTTKKLIKSRPWKTQNLRKLGQKEKI